MIPLPSKAKFLCSNESKRAIIVLILTICGVPSTWYLNVNVGKHFFRTSFLGFEQRTLWQETSCSGRLLFYFWLQRACFFVFFCFFWFFHIYLMYIFSLFTEVFFVVSFNFARPRSSWTRFTKKFICYLLRNSVVHNIILKQISQFIFDLLFFLQTEKVIKKS